jgi:hypothetical protein
MKSTVQASMRLATIRLSTEDLHKWTPVIVGSTGVFVVILIAANPGGIVPNTYTCVPWSDKQADMPLNFEIKTWEMWLFVNIILFSVTFYSGFIFKIWTFWTWDKTYFSSKTSAAGAAESPGGARSMIELIRVVELWSVAYGGELSLTVINYVGLLFSFVHISYLVTMVSARGCVIVFFSWLKRREMRRIKQIHNHTSI